MDGLIHSSVALIITHSGNEHMHMHMETYRETHKRVENITRLIVYIYITYKNLNEQSEPVLFTPLNEWKYTSFSSFVESVKFDFYTKTKHH